MKTKTLLNEFFRYVILNICGMIGLSCYILADTFFISNGLGANGLTALNLAIPIYSFIHGSGLMFGMGGATKYSICRGQKEYKNADQCFSDTMYIMSVLAVIFMLTGIFFSEKLTILLGADKDVFLMTKTYLQVILLFASAFMANDTLICFVRNDGNPKLSMIGMLTGSFSNIILDYVFIFPPSYGNIWRSISNRYSPRYQFMHFIEAFVYKTESVSFSTNKSVLSIDREYHFFRNSVFHHRDGLRDCHDSL